MARSNIREVEEGLQYQGEDESIVYTVNTTAVGDDPTSPVLTVKQVVSGIMSVCFGQ